MGKRCLSMFVYNPAAKRPRTSPAAEAGTVVPYNAPAAAQPLDTQPLNDVPWQQPQPQRRERRPRPAPPLSAFEHEPMCLRSHVLQVLGLRGDLQMHFIDAKTVTMTDLHSQHNRFRIPTNGVLQRLRPLLTPEELDAASLLYDPEPRAKPPKQLPRPAENSAAANDQGASSEQPPAGEEMKKERKTGRVHGGLPVRLVDLAAGVSCKLELSRWESSHGTVVKGVGYNEFILGCSFKEKDVVEIWAFKQRLFRYFGVTMCEDSMLHLFLVKRDGNLPKTCFYCPLPPVEPDDGGARANLV